MQERPFSGCAEEAFGRKLYQLIDEFIRIPDYATMGEIIHLLVTFQNVSSVLEDYASTTAAHVVTSVEAFGARSSRAAARRKSLQGCPPQKCRAGSNERCTTKNGNLTAELKNRASARPPGSSGNRSSSCSRVAQMPSAYSTQYKRAPLLR